MKAVGLQLALDLMHEKVICPLVRTCASATKVAFLNIQGKRDLVTGLKSRTNAGRPNWNKV